ncbi:DUF4214 domain-containing protein, partial [Klebsiella pneumoniae]|uniref:DUF4214 domain-containing protein n=1 Tax=Klebsiella pneumoniae TaxID=573 RepID=UPI0013D56D4B
VTSTLSITDAAGNTASVTGNAVTVDTLAYQSLFGTLVHDAGTALGQVVELYLGLLGRAPDAAGIETWSRALANGATVGQIAEGFLA